nr:reverse transcriptase domain-containing protein [Tanacetum cinerariifolium]
HGGIYGGLGIASFLREFFPDVPSAYESLIRRRSLCEPSSLFDFEEVMSIPHNNQGPLPPNNHAPPPVVRPNGPAPRPMEELCKPSIHGWGRPIASIPIQATDFGLCHHMIQQVQNTFQFHRLLSADANRHIDKFLEVTQQMKQNGVSDDALRLYLFPYSLTHHATAWHRDTINAAAGRTFMQKTPEECYELIENMIAHHNHWDTSATQDETSRTISATTTESLDSLPSNTIANPRGDVKAITTRSGVAYDGPMFPPTPSPLPKVVECKTEETKDKMQTTRSESTTHVQTLVVQVTILEPDVAPKPKPSIPYPSRLNDQKLREKTNSQMMKFLQIFQRLHLTLALRMLFFIYLSVRINLIPLYVWKKLSLPDLTPTRMTLGLATRSFAYRAGIAEDVFVQVRKFTFPVDFVVVDYDVDPRIPFILGRLFLRTARALVDDNNFYFEADLREVKFLLNQDPSTESNIKTIDPILEKFTDEPSLDYLPPSGDENYDFSNLKYDNNKWKNLLYGDSYKDIDSEKDKNKDSKMKALVVEAHIVESNDLLP